MSQCQDLFAYYYHQPSKFVASEHHIIVCIGYITAVPKLYFVEPRNSVYKLQRFRESKQ